MLNRNSSKDKKIPVKGLAIKVEKVLIDTICTECG
jgi:hypothetical protein